MALRILWDDKETAILIDYYIQVRNGKLTRAQAIADASIELRNLAVQNGIEIDDLFRNENGIAMQMSKIEDLFLGRKGRLSKAPQVFVDTVNQYLTNRSAFDEILRKARKASSDSISVQEQLMVEAKEVCNVDFKLDQGYLFTCPIVMSYFGETREVENWVQVYVQMTSFLYQDYPAIFAGLACKNLNQGSYIDIADNNMSSQMTAPKEFASGLYIETNLSATDIVSRIKLLLDLCHVDYENVRISYKLTELTQESNAAITLKRQSDTSYGRETADIDVPETDGDLASYNQILFKEFPNGCRIESKLELRRFISHYNALFGTTLDASNDSVRKRVQQDIIHAGIRHEDFVFSIDSLISAETKEHLLGYIERCFSQGKQVLYYSALFEEFNDEFLGQRIYDENMLRTYLKYECKNKYVFGRSYMSQEGNVQIEIKDEIKQVLIFHGSPMKCREIYESLPHFSKNWIEATLHRNKEFIYNARNEYFHVSLIDLSDDELEKIAELIQNIINNHYFVSGNEMIDAIRTKYPMMLERFPQFSQVGLRDSIAYYLGAQFSFNGNIISSLQKQLSMNDVFAEFAKTHSVFTLDELNVLKREMNSPIYFEAIYENSLRVSRERFVSKEEAHFDVKGTDRVIASYCIGAYLPLAEISSFGAFPYAGFPWNIFLLEHYVASYSAEFKLLHIGYNADKCVGAIVKKDSGISDFNALITHVLAHSGINLNKKDALQYLYDMGYLARRRFSDIDQILVRAKAQKG